jgi:histidinol dehydrogenase
MQDILFPPRSEWKAILKRPTQDFSQIAAKVQPILDHVQRKGDAALKHYAEVFDHVVLTELSEAVHAENASISQELKEAIDTAYANIWAFHLAQKEHTKIVETMQGVICWRKSVAIDKVGLYIPGGTAPLFSTLLMLGIPAKIAGCKELVLCTPPNAEGKVHPAILYAASKVGVTHLFKVGGAQAIAAMAFGTESVPQVYKIFGPGNQYVTAAKQIVQQYGVAIDLPAGPSEVAIFADESAKPNYVAADLLSQAEHGADSQVLLVSTSETVIKSVQEAIQEQLSLLPRADFASQSLANSKAIVVENVETAMALLNEYAPEHLILATDHADSLAEHVTNAGSVFIGHYSPESVGDYASGTNHTLPTNGFARAYSGVSVDSFVKKITFQKLTEQGLSNIGKTVEIMAEAEGLEAHKNAVTLRLNDLKIQQDESHSSSLPHRTATIHRKTNETDIRIQLDLDGSGKSNIYTGLGFFDHMLEQVARHSECDLNIHVFGDLHIDEHHTIEDTALALGQAFDQALGDKRGIERYGFFLPMDDVLAQVSLDFSGRSWIVWNAEYHRERVGEMPTEMFYHFFKSFCDMARANLNVKVEGENEHHKIEATFKAFAKAIKMAVKRDPNRLDILPSTKGML